MQINQIAPVSSGIIKVEGKTVDLKAKVVNGSFKDFDAAAKKAAKLTEQGQGVFVAITPEQRKSIQNGVDAMVIFFENAMKEINLVGKFEKLMQRVAKTAK